MDEKQWMTSILELLNQRLTERDVRIVVSQGTKLAYACEIVKYSGSETTISTTGYETDLLIVEHISADIWKPRLIIEGKLSKVTTHDAIIYSQKALTHKNVHPYLRYGILLGARQHYPLPGRLVRHGAYFDFMFSCVAAEPSPAELNDLLQIVLDEVEASRYLEEILYNSRKSTRMRYTVLHRPLRLKQ